MHILVTRPIAQALKTRDLLRAMGCKVSLAPMLEVVFPDLAFLEPERFQAILVTSSNAIDGLLRHAAIEGLRAVPLYAVGDGTARAAERAGWYDVHSAAGAVDDLAALAAATLKRGGKHVLYAAGSHRTGDLEGKLGACGLSVEVAEMYRVRTVETFPPAVAAALMHGEIHAVVVYSARAAAAFVACAERSDLTRASKKLRFCALSPAVAAPLLQAGYARVAIAGEPTEAALFRELPGPGSTI